MNRPISGTTGSNPALYSMFLILRCFYENHNLYLTNDTKKGNVFFTLYVCMFVCLRPNVLANFVNSKVNPIVLTLGVSLNTIAIIKIHHGPRDCMLSKYNRLIKINDICQMFIWKKRMQKLASRIYTFRILIYLIINDSVVAQIWAVTRRL